MIKKRIEKIFRLSILIFFRQVWKLVCNIYHLLNQPFLTIKTLIKEKDKSQIFLLVIMIFMPIFGYIVARIIWDIHKYGFVLNSIGMVFTATAIVETIIFGYIGYWLFRALKRN